MSRLRHISLFIALMLVLPLQAQLLYEISGRSAPKSYLLAINKYCNIEFLDTIPNLFATLGRCNTIITEMSIDSVNLQGILETATILPDSATVFDLYSSDEIQRISTAFSTAFALPLTQIARLRPSALMEMYRDELMRQWLKYDSSRNADLLFQSLAQQTDKRSIALDSPTESMYMLFLREPESWQKKELLKLIDHPERDINLERNLLNLYKNGQITQMSYELSSPDNTSTLSYSDYEIFATRNKTWVKRLDSHLLEGNVFIALDAKYLGGEKGLIALLRANGYKVRPVNKALKNKALPADNDRK